MYSKHSLVIFIAATGLLSSCASLVERPQKEASPILPGGGIYRNYIGPVAGINRSLHSGGFSSRFSEASCPNFEEGTDNGFYLGFSGEYLIGENKNSTSSIIARVIYDYQPAFFERPGDVYPSRLQSGAEINTMVRHTTTVKYSLIQFEAMYKFNLPGTMLGLTAGPQIGIPVRTEQDQRYELVFDPNNPGISFVDGDLEKIVPKEHWTMGFKPRFTDEYRTAIQLYDGPVINASSFRAAVKLGLQYELLLGMAVLVPCAYYNLGITKMNPDDPWRMNAIQFGADLRYAF